MSNNKIKILIIIVNWNERDLLKQCLTSLNTHLPLPYTIIVVDNGSSDGSTEMIKEEFPTVILLENKENVGFARANNQALAFIRARQLKADYIIFLNNDVILRDDSLGRLTNFLENHHDIAAAGPAVFFSNGLPQVGAAGYFPTICSIFNYAFFLSYLSLKAPPLFPGFFLHQVPYIKKKKPVEVDWVSGVSLVTRYSIWKKVAGFPEDYFMYAEDIALCREIKKVGKIIYFPKARVYHLKEKAATPGTKWLESLFYYLRQSGFSQSKIQLIKLILWLGYELRFLGYIFRPHHRRQKPYSFRVVREARLFLRRILLR